MTGTDILTNTLAVLQVIHERMSISPTTVGFLSLFSVSMNLWAISALKAFGTNGGTIGDAVDVAYDRSLGIVMRFLVVVGAWVVFTLGGEVLTSHLPDQAFAVAGVVAAVLGVAGWVVLPRSVKRWESRILARMGNAANDGPIKSFLRGFVRFDPRRPGPMINLFYAKVLILDSIVCAFFIVTVVNAALPFLGVRSWTY